MIKKLFISFSGGETSAYMLLWILENWKNHYEEMVIIFANTGQENEATLLFVAQVAALARVKVVWVEAVVHHGKRKGCTHKVVDFLSASRNGEPFEDVIKKYGIPNQQFPHCTRELKLNPMVSYIKSLGWDKYDTAVGIRADEIDRMGTEFKGSKLVYPLIKNKPMTKPQINEFWDSMPFRLQLKGYQGNCKWCWKKSDRKHFTLIKENPTQYDFPAKMEAIYGKTGAGIEKGVGCNSEGRRVFFRKNRSTEDLIIASTAPFTPADDDSIAYDPELDMAGSCSESCDAFAAA